MIRVEKTHLPVAALTHPGMKGKNNEDRFGVSAFRMQTQPETPVLLAVLSDGIGGNRAGEVASELAVNLISQIVADSDGRNPPRILEEAIHEASEHIYQQAQGNPDQHGMGATCACAWIAGDRLFTATVGDSRIYLMREAAIRQISTDHTWIQEALERGLIQPEEVNGHPNAHVIRRYLGSPNPPEVDFRVRMNGENDVDALANQGLQLQPDDRVLLCSDGLTDLVSDEEILAAFQEETLEEAGQKLIDLANQRGGHDNITLVAMQIPELSARTIPVAARPARTRSRARSLLVGCLGVVVFAALVGALAGGWFLYSGRGNPAPTATITLTAAPSPTGPTLTPSVTGTLTITPSPFASGTILPAPRLPAPGIFPSPTVWPTNTPGLPVVTVTPQQ
jgi:PPM family protein phosphatase